MPLRQNKGIAALIVLISCSSFLGVTVSQGLSHKILVVALSRIDWSKYESRSVHTAESHFKQSLLLVNDPSGRCQNV